MVENLVLLALEKSTDIVLGIRLKKFWESVLSDSNIKRASNLLKMQILMLYLDWVLLKTPVKAIPKREKENLSQ
ncbi:hypothetical protein [Microcoleus sp. FACHB-68]|uniref:hypothetical protein n=1 Tax=Microcoleus sp. FACHB-68 TaxID=2692826 RepID=UPI00168669DE|nr:hypothetical protein [Microcoleus sp. FACHB-68]MBD1938226.1 hypothetical protein [Microcoleus sp. FACHB-68]